MENKIIPAEKLQKISKHWSPAIIGQLNDYELKLAKIKGEFVWHKHDATDELFMVISGSMKILFRDGEINLDEGEIYIVPKGVEHKPVAENECSILLLEPAGIINTGDTKSHLTKINPERI